MRPPEPTLSKLATFHKRFHRVVTQLDVYWKITDFPRAILVPRLGGRAAAHVTELNYNPSPVSVWEFVHESFLPSPPVSLTPHSASQIISHNNLFSRSLFFLSPWWTQPYLHLSHVIVDVWITLPLKACYLPALWFSVCDLNMNFSSALLVSLSCESKTVSTVQVSGEGWRSDDDDGFC